MSDYKKGDTASWDAGEVRRAQGERPAQPVRRRKKRRVNPILRFFAYILFVAIASGILASVGWLLMSDLCAFNRGTVVKATVEVTAEDSVSTIAEKLQDAGLIKYKWFFRLFAGFSHAQEKIGIGTYELNTDMDYRALITGMRNTSGNMTAETVRVTIPEGYTVAQTIALLAKNKVNTEEALLEAAKTADFEFDYIDNDSEDISRLEGFLFPDTYEFYVNEKPANALKRLISNFDRKMDEDRMAAVENSGHSLKEIITIASLIEKETDGTDQRKIASVIYNRLADDGSHGTYRMLNIDAALIYALGGKETLTESDKQFDSPYNTYLYQGLTPGPIANPGLSSLNAALVPEDTNYYFYALDPSTGAHHFSTTQAEHDSFLASLED